LSVMNDFITMATFTLPSEMVIARSKLESEGIECQTLDELTVKSYNFLSNAMGGVKLQVRSLDISKRLNLNYLSCHFYAKKFTVLSAM